MQRCNYAALFKCRTHCNVNRLVEINVHMILVFPSGSMTKSWTKQFVEQSSDFYNLCKIIDYQMNGLI